MISAPTCVSWAGTISAGRPSSSASAPCGPSTGSSFGTGRWQSSPIKNLALPKLGKRLPKFLTPEQMADLLAAPLKLLPARGNADSDRAAAVFACRRDVAILETIYSCGLRISELCGLVAQDIDWNERLVRVRGKGKKERLVPIGEPALEAIEDYWSLLPQSPAGESPVFLAGPKKRTPVSPPAPATAPEEISRRCRPGPAA